MKSKSKSTQYNAIDEFEPQLMSTTFKKPPYSQFIYEYIIQEIHFYISDEIGAPDEYIDMIHKINIAGPNDKIHIHLNTSGGRLDAGIQIINAIKNTEAEVFTILEGMAYSLGTLIFLSGHTKVVYDNSIMMFHNFRSGVMGKGNELTAELDATIKWFSDLARDIYIPFLTEDEFNRILKGEDLWMHTADIKERLDKVANPQVDVPSNKRTRKK